MYSESLWNEWVHLTSPCFSIRQGCAPLLGQDFSCLVSKTSLQCFFFSPLPSLKLPSHSPLLESLLSPLTAMALTFSNALLLLPSKLPHLCGWSLPRNTGLSFLYLHPSISFCIIFPLSPFIWLLFIMNVPNTLTHCLSFPNLSSHLPGFSTTNFLVPRARTLESSSPVLHPLSYQALSIWPLK